MKPPPRSTSADTEKNVPDNFGFGARQKNFLKRTGHFFGVLPSRSRAGLQKNKKWFRIPYIVFITVKVIVCLVKMLLYKIL